MRQNIWFNVCVFFYLDKIIQSAMILPLHMHDLLALQNKSAFNPFVTNGFSHSYHLDDSIFIFRGIRSKFSFFFFIFR